MRYSKLLSLVPLISSLASAQAFEHRLVSKRLHKRGIDVDGHYNISIYHINDVHAHLDQFRSSGADCTDLTRGCYGGYARVKEVIDKERPTKEDSLFLNAGDEFQGTLFYSFYGGEKIAETLNQLGFDAMTVGNHEFDGGDDKLAEFLGNLTFPAISANIHTNNTALASKLVPYKIFPKHKLAIVAVTTETTPGMSRPGPGTRFEDPLTAIQRTVNEIKGKEKIDRIIALTHIGYDKDIELAKKTKGISLIIGGHSHTPLGDFPGAVGKYPTIEENLDGDEVFIVTAYRWGEYLGYIDIAYDNDGKIVGYSGAPIHLTNQTTQDPDLQRQITEWRKPFEALSREVLGETKVPLQQTNCQQEECTLGDLMADAMVDYRRKLNPAVDFAIINAGGIRAEIDVGPITRGEVLTAFPFGNSIVELSFSGEVLWKIFEGAVSHVSVFNGRPVTSFIQVSAEINLEYNPANEVGQRLITLQIGGKPVDWKKKYDVVTLDFLAGGGDNIWERRSYPITLDSQDEVLIQYLEKKSPVEPKLSGRIVQTDKTSPENPEQRPPTIPTPTPTSTPGKCRVKKMKRKVPNKGRA
ncbi:Metallo-dependent phosphatase [Terfezia boudieri ATCC MYA-4762]|uniref:Metallo-dependent phosphatase n=1 Tax=Terfezia boudieri ATCC MYA-4762 TaxID=1051890 RepID=A0A3N4LP54_9PEZI|nr:Metallo-dependent phosphatase [Terfezia boudieri ATCC MYA-4762]